MTLENLRTQMADANTLLRKVERALWDSPEWKAVYAAREKWMEAEEAFMLHGGGEFRDVEFCEHCGIPLRADEVERQAINEEGDDAPFCKDGAACNKRIEGRERAP